MPNLINNFVKIVCLITFLTYGVNAKTFGSVTGFEIPRFVSIKSSDVNLRIGPSKNYYILINYIEKNLPVEIIEELDDWRKIRDLEGNNGWIHKNLLTGERFGIIINKTENYAPIHYNPKGKIKGSIGIQNIIEINKCLQDLCLIKKGNYTGWINKKYLWGVYANEQINISFYQPIIEIKWKITNLLIY
jgi:SH3-like domain-containing protein